MFSVFRKNKTSIFGLVLTLVIVLLAVFAPFFTKFDPTEQSIRDRLQGPSGKYVLGTDRLGRDIFSRIVHAARISLSVGFGAAFLGAMIGTLSGVFATLKGGLWESALLKAVDVMMSFPTLILCLLVLTILGPGLTNVLFAVGIALAPRFARISRGPTLALREIEFIEAARAVGASQVRIAFRHILPNIIGPIGVMVVLWMATAIRIEASLSFLGFGVQPPIPTWGNMIEEGFRSLSFAPRLSLFPGLSILLTVLGLNLLGDGLRDVFDPKTQE